MLLSLLMNLRSPKAALLALALPLLAAPAAAAPQTGRAWVYGAYNLQFSPNWGFTAMPGIRFEYARTGAPTREHYLDELFLGPNFGTRFLDGALGFRLSLWYYFIGYPSATSSRYPVSHNVELIPTVDYRLGALNLSYRIIFHNTVYASVYDSGKRGGFGTVMRNLVMAKYAIADNLTLAVGDEPWFGIIENGGTPYSSAGYWKQGFRLNRLYAGVDWKAGALTVSPQYVLESTVDNSGKLAETGHYLFLTVAYSHRLF